MHMLKLPQKSYWQKSMKRLTFSVESLIWLASKVLKCQADINEKIQSSFEKNFKKATNTCMRMGVYHRIILHVIFL